MNKKILIGSIIAVAILIGVSFTSVVGFQSVKSNSVKASPLFTVRTKRAIDEESKDFTCDYIGKGEHITLSIPKRNDRTVLLQKFIDRISKMDDETLEKLIVLLINHAQRDKRLNDENPDKIREALYLLRYSDKTIPIFDVNAKNKDYTAWFYGTALCYTYCGGWLFCIFTFIYLIPLMIIWIIVDIITVMLNCRP